MLCGFLLPNRIDFLPKLYQSQASEIVKKVVALQYQFILSV